MNLSVLDQRISECRVCPRLVEWREKVAREKRAAFRDETYWGRPVPGFGPPDARMLIVGLAPAAHGANRTGRMFTGDRSGELEPPVHGGFDGDIGTFIGLFAHAERPLCVVRRDHPDEG